MPAETAEPGVPRVSIGLPVYNGDRFLVETLQSIRGQDYGDWELVISDNGSTDGTADICRDFAATDARVRYHHVAANRGAAWNYNRVFALSRGAYFKWAAADDILAPTHLSSCVRLLDEAPESVVLCYPRTVLIDHSGQPLKQYQDRLDLRASQPHARLRKLLRNQVLCNAVFGVIRRDALASTRLIGAFNQSDVILLAELSLLGQFWELPEPLFHRRVHTGMSGRANATPDALRRWFDPTRAGARVFTKSRLYAECFRSVHRAQITAGQRTLSVGVVLTTGSRKYWRGIGSEFQRALLGDVAQPRIPRLADLMKTGADR